MRLRCRSSLADFKPKAKQSNCFLSANFCLCCRRQLSTILHLLRWTVFLFCFFLTKTKHRLFSPTTSEKFNGFYVDVETKITAITLSRSGFFCFKQMIFFVFWYTVNINFIWFYRTCATMSFFQYACHSK